MELPNYYLADLPGGTALSAKLIAEACATLRGNRAKFLVDRSTESLIAAIAGVGRDWLDHENPFRKHALEAGPGETGFSRPTLAAGLDRFFRQITRGNLETLIAQDLGSARRLDGLATDATELREGRRSLAHGHELLVQITGGALPNGPITSIILGLLARSAQFIKCGTGASFLPRMFAHSLYAAEPKLGACLEIAEWKGGTAELEEALFAEADCVTASGSDETLGAIRQRLPGRTRFAGYGHRVSLALVARESLAGSRRAEAIPALVEDIVAWNQLGCLSPHVIYVETGGATSPAGFAEALAAGLANREREEPRGDLPAAAAAGIATRRMFYQVRAAAAETTRIWQSEGSTAWTVIYEDDPEFQLSCLNRLVYVKPVAGLEALLTALACVRGKVSTVGLSAPRERVDEIAPRLARWGASRICPAGQMQNPPLTWRHDGRPALGDLIVWTDVEFA